MSSPTATSTPPDLAARLAGAVVCVLAGGRSSEREVSLASGTRVAEALGTPADADDARGPSEVREVELGPDGGWRVDGRSLAPGAALEALAAVDLFFLALHGGEGEDGTIQGLLSASDRAFTGTGVTGSAVGMDKVLSRDLVRLQGVRVAPASLVERGRWRKEPRAVLRELEGLGGATPGWAVKPRCGGSSVGASVVASFDQLDAALERALEEEDEVLVEAAVRGVEVTGAVLEHGGETVALPTVEIRPRAGAFFDYHEKYAADGAEELCPAPSLSPALEERVRELALTAHRTLRAEGYSRSDFLVPGPAGDPNREPVFLELNTLPGLTPRSLVPLAAETVGISYRDLCLAIAADGLARGARRRG